MGVDDEWKKIWRRLMKEKEAAAVASSKKPRRA